VLIRGKSVTKLLKTRVGDSFSIGSGRSQGNLSSATMPLANLITKYAAYSGSFYDGRSALAYFCLG
jgi:hypothetical protein